MNRSLLFCFVFLFVCSLYAVSAAVPSRKPTQKPTVKPFSGPTRKPSTKPTVKPSRVPTIVPTVEPTSIPTEIPTPLPTGQPSSQPSAEPSSFPTSQPSGQPTSQPSPKYGKGNNDSTGLNSGQIAGIFISIVAAVVWTAIIIYCRRKRNAETATKPPTGQSRGVFKNVWAKVEDLTNIITSFCRRRNPNGAKLVPQTDDVLAKVEGGPDTMLHGSVNNPIHKL